jgi:uncharacterized DUF497 family protein
MRDVVRDLLTTHVAAEKLGRRGISIAEANQLVHNPQMLVRNAARNRRDNRDAPARWLLIGLTDGNRALALVVERTIDPTRWLVVTGWQASNRERRMLRR